MVHRKIEGWRQENILVLEMNNPPANTYTCEMLRELDDWILQARFDEEIRAVVLTGKLERFFSAGGDLKVLVDKPLWYRYYFALQGQEVVQRMRYTPKMLVAAINGHAVGGGLELALASHIRIAKRDSGRMGLTEVHLGLMPGMGGTQLLSRLIGSAKALELCCLGRQLAFEEALELGLIHAIYEKSDYLEHVLCYTKQLLDNASRKTELLPPSPMATGLEPELRGFE